MERRSGSDAEVSGGTGGTDGADGAGGLSEGGAVAPDPEAAAVTDDDEMGAGGMTGLPLGGPLFSDEPIGDDGGEATGRTVDGTGVPGAPDDDDDDGASSEAGCAGPGIGR